MEREAVGATELLGGGAVQAKAPRKRWVGQAGTWKEEARRSDEAPLHGGEGQQAAGPAHLGGQLRLLHQVPGRGLHQPSPAQRLLLPFILLPGFKKEQSERGRIALAGEGHTLPSVSGGEGRVEAGLPPGEEGAAFAPPHLRFLEVLRQP